MTASPSIDESEVQKQRQVIYWRLLAAIFGLNDQARNIEQMTGAVVEEAGLPRMILDPVPAIDTLVQRYPELKADFDALQALRAAETVPAAAAQPADLRQALCYSKLLLNVFGPNTLTSMVTAGQYREWCEEAARFEACLGYQPGELRGKRAQGRGGEGTSLTEEQLQAGLAALEGELIQRMALREVLKDDAMAAQLTPSMSLIEQLLLDKANLSDKALKNAKMLIRKYVDQLAEVLRTQVAKAVKGKIDRSIPPKRVYRNLDLRRTLWKNLINYNPDDGRLYVDQLFYRHTSAKTTPKRLIVVVDQSGSMVDAMVQTAILASIFASLPKVEVHLLAFDTNVIDLTPWVHEPFEMLMRTNLGGGNDGPKAMVEALTRVVEPRNTVMVWISDFYEFQNDRPLFEQIKAVKEAGIRFIPVGSLKSNGYFNVNEWFRTRLKELGTPVLSGSIQKLIAELKVLL